MKTAQTLVAVVLFAALVAPAALAASGKVGEKVTDFELKDVDGKLVKSAEFRKDKAYVIKFGATWCPPCNRQISELNKVVEEYGDKVAVLDVDVREPAEKVKAHAKKTGIKYKVVLDADGAVAKDYGVRGIPVVIVADKDGKVLYSGHYTKYEVLKKHLDAALAEKTE